MLSFLVERCANNRDLHSFPTRRAYELDETISGKIAKTVSDALWQGETDSVDAYIDAKGLKQVSDSSNLAPIVTAIIANNPKQVEQYRAGKTKLLGFFVGQVMKETGGKANPKQVNDLVRIQLDTV